MIQLGCIPSLSLRGAGCQGDPSEDKNELSLEQKPHGQLIAKEVNTGRRRTERQPWRDEGINLDQEVSQATETETHAKNALYTSHGALSW